MKTLLEKVKKVEDEAARLVEEAQQTGQQKLHTLTAQEPRVLERVRQAAESEGQLIIKEKLQTARQEIDAIRQEGKQAAEKISQVATRNREQTIKKITELFEEEYGLV